jgi:small GTP-binding protein
MVLKLTSSFSLHAQAMLQAIQKNVLASIRKSVGMCRVSRNDVHETLDTVMRQCRSHQLYAAKNFFSPKRWVSVQFRRQKNCSRLYATGTSQSSPIKPVSGFETTLRQVLTPKQEQILKEEVSLLNELLDGLKEFGATQNDLREVKKSIQQLEQLFLLVVVGEFNSGKSSFLNALLGKKWLPEGITPTTSKIHLLRYGDEFQLIDKIPDDEGSSDKVIVTIPVEWLKQISLVDTPGTNAVIKSHQDITENFIPRSDLVLFVTSSDRAFTESERSFMSLVHEYRKKFVIVLSKIDLLEEPHQIEELKAYVREQCRKFFGEEPEIFPVSSKLAIKAKTSVAHIQNPQERQQELQKNPNWVVSRFGALETYILQHLNPQKRTFLKLKNPLGIAERLVKKYLQELKARTALIEVDVDVLKNIQQAIDDFQNDMKKDFRYHQEHIDNVLLRLQQRGEEWFNDNIVLTKIFSLIRSETLRQQFEKEVVMEFSKEVEQHIAELVDWFLEKQGKFWTRTVEYMMTRVQNSRSDKIVGKLQMQFHYDRASLLQTIGESSKSVVQSWDKDKEVQELSAKITAAVYQTAVLEFGVIVGLATALSFALLDITGILAATGVAVGGFGLLPYRRYALRSNFKKQIQTVRDRMKETLEIHFLKQLAKCVHDLEDNFRPYTHFITKEYQKLQDTNDRLQKISKSIPELSQLIDANFEKI